MAGDCVSCGALEHSPTYGGLTRCHRCGHVWADVQIDNARLRALYDRHYFFGQEYTDYLADAPMARRNFDRRLSILRRYLTPVHSRLFEIGAAYGLFLDTARPYFSEVSGIDISEDAVAYAREKLSLAVHLGDLLDTDLGTAQYDVACLWDTVEHLKAPDRYLERIAGHMPRGSVLALTTGDIASVNARIRREHWRLIHPPTHLHYFSRRSITHFLDRYGFDIVYARHCGISRSFGAMVEALTRGHQSLAGATRWIGESAVARWPIYLNLGDILYVIAVKRA
jgi:2-polyprenyl-3-methyl-5-hydroxy-6-metoxy-1,4-benzoquinol methylase